jgi:hypothetical protein
LRYCRERDRDLVGIAISDMIFYRHIVAIYELFIKYIHHQHNFNCNQINYFEIESNNAISIAPLMLLYIDFLINICFCILEYQIENKYMILKPAICYIERFIRIVS